MALVPERVMARYLEAALIGDPKEFLERYAKVVEGLEIDPKHLGAAKVYCKFYADAVQAGNWDFKDKSDQAALRAAEDVGYRAYALVAHGSKRLLDSGHQLFLSILQTMALPTALRKKVEMAIRVYLKQPSRPRIKSQPGVSRAIQQIDVYLKFMEGVHGHLDLAKKAIAQGKEHAEEGPTATKVRVGSFTLVNTGGFDAKTMADVVEVMKKAETLLQSSGVGQVCYGEVQVTNTIHKANVLAFYLIANDELFVRANIKSTTDSLRTVLHELGHRYEHKFLPGKKRDVEHLYYLISGQERDHQKKQDKPPPGEIWVSPKGKKYRVTGYLPGRAGLQVLMTQEDEPTMQARISLEGYLAAKGQNRNVDEEPDYKGFVTDYAKESPAENFAEMFAYYCQGRLPVLQSVAFEELAFGGGSSHPLGQSIFAARRTFARWVMAGIPQ